MHTPLLSILIATRNRQETASIVIAEILDLELPNVELVVSDTSHENNLLEMVLKRTNKKKGLVYKHTTAALSMTENYSRTIDMASGEYLCMIGDDDFVLPNIIEAAQFAKKHTISSMTQHIQSEYIWENETQGNFKYVSDFKRETKVKSTKKALADILLKGGMMTWAAPRLYHGIVERKVFTLLKEKTGGYFFGTSPDISASISICCTTESYGISSFQFTIPGASKKSNSSHGIEKKVFDLKSSDHLKLHRNEIWPLFLPPIWVAETSWPEAVYKTLLVLDPIKISSINKLYIYVLMMVKYRQARNIIKPTMYRYISDLSFWKKLIAIIKLFIMTSAVILRKLKNTLLIRSHSSILPPHIPTLEKRLLNKL
jgi:glycosyltransferase involved in cell wall biosynthesis